MRKIIIYLFCSILLLFNFITYAEEVEVEESEPIINLLEFSEDLETLAQLQGQELIILIGESNNRDKTENINWG